MPVHTSSALDHFFDLFHLRQLAVSDVSFDFLSLRREPLTSSGKNGSQQADEIPVKFFKQLSPLEEPICSDTISLLREVRFRNDIGNVIHHYANKGFNWR